MTAPRLVRRATAQRSESQFWYVELKYLLQETLNHGFKYLRWIVCWDFAKNINKETEFAAVQESDGRALESIKMGDHTVYFLNSKTSAVKIQVLRLKQFLQEALGIQFKDQT